MTLTFKIQIRDIKKPPVWRRLEIPAEFTFDDFHNAIQEAFGWWNYHLYEFSKGPFDNGWAVKTPSETDDEMGYDVTDAQKTRVFDFLMKKHLTKFVYVYDFGDSWVHDITLEDMNPKSELDYPICLAGKGACPHEDCGGAWGYEDLKRRFKEDPNGEETLFYKEWMGLDEDEEFDPNFFDIDEVNMKLRLVGVSSDGRETDKNIKKKNKLKGPKSISLLDSVKRLDKFEIIDFADNLGIEIDENASEKRVREQYAQAILNHPRQILDQLPMQDLSIIEKLKKGGDGPDIVNVYEDYFKPLIVYFGLVAEWRDGNDYYIHFPIDLREAFVPLIDEAMNDMRNHIRITIESEIEGRANLYGQVSLGFMKQELVRCHQAQSLERAELIINETREQSLLLKWTEFQLGNNPFTAPTDDTLIFLSRYGWDTPKDLVKEIEKHRDVAPDYRLFQDIDIVRAARNPCPLIPNPKQVEFHRLLTDRLHLNEWEVIKTCHDLWYYTMHKGDEEYEHADPGQYFVDCVLDPLELDDNLYGEAMKMLDDYLNNMPHWQLKGHTPAETMAHLESHQQPKTHTKRSHQTIGYEDDDLWSPYSMTPTMPIITPKEPRRNDPCPCGSGKKYKNCCGRGS